MCCPETDADTKAGVTVESVCWHDLNLHKAKGASSLRPDSQPLCITLLLLATVSRTATFAAAAVLALAAVISRAATTFAFTRILTFTAMLFLSFLLRGSITGLSKLRIAVVRGLSIGSAGHHASKRSCSNQCGEAVPISAEQQIALGKRWSMDISVALIDIDHFKKINDCYGHEIGDKVIKAISSDLKAVARTADLCARWGGEEFLIVMPKTELSGALSFAERIRSSVSELRVVSGDKLIAVNVSVGVAQLRPNEEFSDSVRRADEALYRAKESGRNCVKADFRVEEGIL